ncbi:MAG TPA: hypothetical protein VLJ60_03340 [bacterium]|nr:hypothetical protein [bacterium]
MKAVCLISILFFVAFPNVSAAENDSEKTINSTVQEAKKDENNIVETSPKENETKTDDNAGESEQGYNLKLRTLEEKINSLKDKIFRSKQRLAILQETVLSGTIAGSRATITHKNEVGSAFKLISVIYYLDDAPVFRKIDSPDELKKQEIVVFDGSVVPGPHHISVFYVFAGKGYGLFSYMKGYTFKMKAGHSFHVEEGNLVEVVISPKDRGASYKLDNRLFTSFNISKRMFEEKESQQEEKQ